MRVVKAEIDALIVIRRRPRCGPIAGRSCLQVIAIALRTHTIQTAALNKQDLGGNKRHDWFDTDVLAFGKRK